MVIMTTLRHSWGESVAMLYKTESVCVRCGLIKVSRHEPYQHWTEWWRPTPAGDVERVEAERTPACVAVEARAAA